MSVFSSLIDQAEVIKALKDAVLASRNDADKTQGMTHAWLFTCLLYTSDAADE